MRILFFCLGVALALTASGEEIKFDFSNCTEGSTPTNFTSTLAGTGQPGSWKIVLDEVPPLLAPLTDKALDVSKRPVLAQLSRNPLDEHFPMFIYDRETFDDFKFSTRFKIACGVVEQMAGLVFRYQNASNFYVLRASALGHNVRFYKVVDGLRTGSHWTVALPSPMELGHTLAVQCQGQPDHLPVRWPVADAAVAG